MTVRFADLDRQFEFVQQRWIANPKFGDPSDEVDPLLGSSTRRASSIPACGPIGTRIDRLPQFAEVTGGGYFPAQPAGARLHWPPDPETAR